jgi:hypothetical protein
MNQCQLQIIDYHREENRVLIGALGGRRMRFNDDQRRRLAAKAEGLGRRILTEVATIVIPETAPSERRRCGTSESGMAHMISSGLRVGEVASTRQPQEWLTKAQGSFYRENQCYRSVPKA